jgi:hypothetical protein
MSATRITLVLPPTSQLNTPYPSIAYLARTLREHGRDVHLRDLSLGLMLKVFSRTGLEAIFDVLEEREHLPEPAWRILALRQQHEHVIDAVIRFLQGKDRTLASRILETPFLPRGPRVDDADLGRYGEMAVDDAARRLCTLYIEDLADLVTATIDLGFGLSRYSHHLCTGPVRFDPIAERLDTTHVVDAMLDALVDEMVEETDPEVVGLSVPFPGMLVAALRIGRRLKARGITVILGGGYVNTELREVDEPRLWDCVDALTYDDGEGPLLALLEHLEGGEDTRHRTRTRDGMHSAPADRPATTPIADYADLPLHDYLQLIDGENPAHRLWSDGRWNKLTLAHGCYWKKCAFCDLSLDYISRYEPAQVTALVDKMEQLIEETGQSGFHMVDEAAPPRLMRELALEILARGLSVSWWGNIRFERAFHPDLARLLAASGLIAVTGGLEVASDRLLELMDKGITIEQAAQTAAAFTEAGVMVHAYLMYGFPTQTEQETVDAMEVVRQMFASGVLSSGFWHRFVLTRHSAVYQDPDAYGVEIPPLPEGPLFATNDIPHLDPTGADPDRFDRGLVHAIQAWMRGEDFDRPVHIWFDPPLIPTTEHPRRVASAVKAEPETGKQLIWTGGQVLEAPDGLTLHSNDGQVLIGGRPDERQWLCELIDAARPGEPPLHLNDAIAAFPGNWGRYQRRWQKVRNAGMLIV